MRHVQALPLDPEDADESALIRTFTTEQRLQKNATASNRTCQAQMEEKGRSIQRVPLSLSRGHASVRGCSLRADLRTGLNPAVADASACDRSR